MRTFRSNVSASSTLLVAAACLVLAPAARATTLAGKAAVVLDFAGPQGKKVQAQVAARIRKKYTVIPQAAFQKVAKQLKIAQPTDDDVANVARKLKADVVVAGIVQKSGKKWQLT